MNADTPQFTARQLVQRIRQQGGRLYRMPEICVFCLTTNRELANWLIEIGGKPFLPAGFTPAMGFGGYKRARGGVTEWDIYIHTIPVRGERTIYEMSEKDAIEWNVGDETAVA